MCVLFAATYPERTSALVHVRLLRATRLERRLPVGADAGGAARPCDERRAGLGRAASDSTSVAPSRRRPTLRERLGELPARCASPGAAVALMRMNAEIDVRDVLPAIQRADARPAPHRRPRRSTSRRAATSPSTSRAHASSSFRATTTCRGVGDPDADPRRGRGVPDRRAAARPSPTACSRRCSSPTSSARPSAPPSSATARWRELLERHHAARARASSSASAAARSTRRATASSPRSTARRARSAARSRDRDAVRELGLEMRAGLHTGECELVGDKVARDRRPHRRPGRRAGRAGRGAGLGDRQDLVRARASPSRSAASTSSRAWARAGSSPSPARRGLAREQRRASSRRRRRASRRGDRQAHLGRRGRRRP